MSVRQPCAPDFYLRESNRKQIERYTDGFDVPIELSNVVAGIVPHAGWMYSGGVAAKVFKCIREKANPQTFILFGTIHQARTHVNPLYSHGSWATPLGDVEVDAGVSSGILRLLGSTVADDIQGHAYEHSLEVQLPFIKYYFPGARIVPLGILPDPNAVELGKAIGAFARQTEKEIVVVGTTDLTHYGEHYGFAPAGYGPAALEWLHVNDKRIVEMALQMRAKEILLEAKKNHNACGSGALAATIAAAEALGAKRGILVEYTTSYDVCPDDDFIMGVGYAGMVF